MARMISRWLRKHPTQTLANRQTKNGVTGSLDEQSRTCRMADMASAAVVSILIPQNPNKRPHSQERNQEAIAWSMIVVAGAGGTMAEIDATTTVAMNEETTLGLTDEVTVTRATAEAAALHITGTA
jgi:hypothetical protein